MKNPHIKRTLIEKRSLSSGSSPDQSPLKHPSKTVDEENLKREKFELLRESFSTNNKQKTSSYLEVGSASQLFDNKTNNVDHAFISTTEKY